MVQSFRKDGRTRYGTDSARERHDDRGDPNDRIEVGQKVAIQRNAFGEVVAEYTSPVSGEVGARRTDASVEPGTPFLFYLIQGSSIPVEDYPE